MSQDQASTSTAGEPTGEPEASRNPFANRDYRTWWAASLVAGLGIGIQIVTVPLFIRDRVDPDDRAAIIAAALIIQTLPGALLTLLGGVIADRMERRLILVRAFAVAAVVSGVYVVLSAADVELVWPVFALAAVIGMVSAFVQPARQSVVPQMVQRPQLQNAIILGNVGFLSATQFAGPGLGGLVGDGAGLTVAFSLEVGLLALGVLLFSLIGRYEPAISERRPIRSDLAEGLRYVCGSPTILGLLALSALPGLVYSGPLTVNMILLVEDVLELSDRWIGIFFAAFGAGIIVSSLLLTWKPLPRRGMLLALTPIIASPVFALFGLSEWPALTLVALLLLGPPAAVFINMALALIQEQAEPAVMGRVMSVYTLAFVASTPLGFAQAGIVATVWGPQVSIVSSALAAFVVGLVLLAVLPVRKLP